MANTKETLVEVELMSLVKDMIEIAVTKITVAMDKQQDQIKALSFDTITRLSILERKTGHLEQDTGLLQKDTDFLKKVTDLLHQRIRKNEPVESEEALLVRDKPEGYVAGWNTALANVAKKFVDKHCAGDAAVVLEELI